MKTQNLLVFVMLAGAAVLAYFFINKKPATQLPVTSTTGTGGVVPFLFGQNPNNGASSSPNYASAIQSGGAFVASLAKLFTTNSNQTSLNTPPTGFGSASSQSAINAGVSPTNTDFEGGDNFTN